MIENKEFPLISVIIPAYQAEKTLLRACNSVFSQSYPNLELVIVNDGSVDGTAKVMDEVAQTGRNVKLIHKENGGVSSARNFGLSHMTGEYLFFLDADDEIPQDAIEKLYVLLVQHQCDIAAGYSLKIRPDGATSARYYEMDGSVLLWEGLEPLEHSLKDHPAGYSSCGKLYRRSCVGDVQFQEHLRIHEDSFFLFEIFQNPVKMVIANECTLHCHLVANSASRSEFSEKFLDILTVAREKQRIVNENHPQFLVLSNNLQIKACLALLKVMRRGCDSRFRPVEKECMQTIRRNSRYFVPAIRADVVMFWIVRMHLYYPLKLVEKIRKQIRK